MTINNNRSEYDITEQVVINDAVAEFLKNGGTITKLETGEITEPEDIVYKFKKQRGPRSKKT